MTFTPERKKELYQALLSKDREFVGTFFVGVKTTGVFCYSSCPARKPKFENCEFFENAKLALLSGYRPCKRCKPLSSPHLVSETVRKLVEAVEAEPEKRWKTEDFRRLSVDESTARRQFQKRFGMTFVEYARNRRMGIAFSEIRKGAPVIDAQLNSGYESPSGFRDAFAKIMGGAPMKVRSDALILNSALIDTPLGNMIAMVDDEKLYLLEFTDRRGLELEVERLKKRVKAIIIPGKNKLLDRLEAELASYFAGSLKKFTIPLAMLGSDFQKSAWQALIEIPYGQTRSYMEQAAYINKPTAFRAVANANGANQIAIVVPCHRIINADGKLGGYGGGIHRKEWLIKHEQIHKEKEHELHNRKS